MTFQGVWVRSSLWLRLVLVVATGFLVLFGIFGLISLRIVNDSTAHILAEREIIAEMAAAQIDSLLSRAFYELEKATTFAAFDPSAADLSAEAHMLAHAYGRIGTLSLGVSFLDARGRVVLSEPFDAAQIGADLSSYPHIQAVIRTGTRNVSAPYLDPRSGKPIVAATIPIFDSTGSLRAILTGLVDLSNPDLIGPVWEAKSLGQTGHAELVNEAGIVVASTEAEEFGQRGEHWSYYMRLLADNGSGVESVPFEGPGTALGERHVMAFVPLKTASWGLAVGGTEAETFAPVRQLETTIFLLGGFSMLVILPIILWGARRLLLPMKALETAAQRISAGDLSTAIHPHGGGEIASLGASLDQMRESLKRSLEEITAWNRELEARVRERTKELEEKEAARGRLLAKVIEAQEEERRRIGRELHDETGQALTALILGLEAAEGSLPPEAQEARERLKKTKSLASDLLSEIRRLILDLRPAALDDLGLASAIRWYAEHRLAPSGIEIQWEGPAIPHLPPRVETVVFRIVQEALNNVLKHAQAKSVRIRLEVVDERVRAVVEDDGRGFQFPSRGPLLSQLGLAGMRERALLLGGSLNVVSQPGKGTRVEVEVPLG